MDPSDSDESALVAHHLQWAERIEDRASSDRKAADRLALGDIVIPTKIAAAHPSVVIDVEYDKVRVVDLLTGEGKPFRLGYLSKV